MIPATIILYCIINTVFVTVFVIITHSSFSSRCHSVIKVPFLSKSYKNLSYMIHKIGPGSYPKGRS